MPTQVQFRRGTTSQNNSFTGAAGELSVDTQLNVLRLHDGSTAGGHALITGSSTVTLTNKTINLTSNTLSGTIAQFNTALSDGDFATLAGTETLTNKTLTSPVISSISNSGTLTLPTSTDTLVGRATTDTLTNKTLTTPTIAQVNASADFTVDAAGDIVLDADGADVLLKDGGTTFGSLSQSGGELVIKSGATPTTAITMSGADVTISGNLTVNGATTSVTSNTVTLGDNTILLNADEAGTPSQDAGIEVERGTSTNASLIWNETSDNWQAGLTGAEVPLVTTSGTQTLSNKTIALGSNTVSGTVAEFNSALTDDNFATLTGAETLTNKTLTTPVISSITNTGTLTLPTSTDTLVGRATTDTLTNKTISVDNNTVSGIAASSFVLSDASGNIDGAASQKVIPTGTVVGTSDTQTLSSKTIALGSNTVSGSISEFNTALTDADFATLAGTETLTNKTITSPSVSGLYLSDASVVFEGTTANDFETTLTVTDPTADRTLTLPNATDTLVGKATTDTLTNKSISLTTNTVTGTLAEFNTAVTDANLASIAGSETLTNKTISVDDNTVSGIAASSFVLSNASGYIDGSASQKAIPTGTVVGTSDSQTLTNKTIALGSNTVSGTLAEFNTAVTDADFASLAGSETLTNKTLTSPVVTGLTLNDASVVFEGATANDFETTLTVTDPTADRTLTLPDATDTLVGRATTDTLTNKSISLTTNTLTGTVAEFNTALSDDNFVTLTGSETLTNKTLTTPVISSISNTGTLTLPTTTDTLVGKATTDTFTNKSISLTTNTLTGTVAEFNTALSDDNFVTLTGTETLTNKTLTSPIMTTPTLGVASATSINKVAITAPATGSTLTIAEGKTLTANNTLTLTGTDSSSVAFGTGGTVAYTANKLSVFAATTSAELAGVISDETGSGSLVFSASPTFTGTVNAADLTLSGNLIVNGTTTTVNSNTVSIGDNIIVLNSDEAGTPSQNAGIEVERGTSTNASVTWDETNDLWMAGITGSEIPLVTTTGTQTLTNKTISGSNNTLSNIANAALTNSTISGKALGTNLDTLTMAVSGTGLSGSQTYNGSAAATFTVTSNATNANTASTIVARDASGNFTAGTITAALSGNASTASAWATGRTLSLTGDVTGTSASFDGSGNISVATTIAANSVALGTDTTGDYVAAVAVSGTGLSVSGSGETATYTVTSNATNANTGSTIVARDASGNFSAGTVTAALSGNATTATTLQTARNIQGVSFNGSADITVVTAGTGVSVSGTAVSIGQAVGTGSNVTFANMTSTGVLTVSNGSTTSNGIKFGADPGGGSGDLAQINYYASAGESTVLHLQVDNDADDTIKLDATGGTDNVGAFRATGEITAFYSDERLKNFSGTIDNALAKVMSLNGYYYTENETAKSFGFKNDQQQVGVSAQQVQSILPEAVRVAPFVRDLNLDTEYLTVQYEKLVPLLIEAIKEQQKKIEELEAKINKQ